MTAPDPIVPGSIPSPRRTDLVGVGMYLLAALLFAFNGSITKNALNAGLDPVHLTAARNAGAMIVIFLILLVTDRRRLAIKRSELPFLIAYGVLGYALVQFLYVFTISRLPVGIGTLLAFLAPIVVALWLRFGRKNAVGSQIWIALFLTIVGLALVAEVWNGFALDTLGVIGGLVLALTLSLYWLLGEAGQKRRDILSLTFWGFFFATVTWSIVAPWWGFPWSVLTVRAEPMFGVDLPVWSLLILIVFIGTVFPFLLVLGSLRRIGSARAGIVGTTEPIWAAIIAFLLLGEALTAVQGLGGLVVLSAVLIAEFAQRRRS